LVFPKIENVARRIGVSLRRQRGECVCVAVYRRRVYVHGRGVSTDSSAAACTLQLRAVMNGTSGDAAEASVFSWTYKRCADSEFAVLGGDRRRRRDRLRGVSERQPGDWMCHVLYVLTAECVRSYGPTSRHTMCRMVVLVAL
jgi:hypothetical protein